MYWPTKATARATARATVKVKAKAKGKGKATTSLGLAEMTMEIIILVALTMAEAPTMVVVHQTETRRMVAHQTATLTGMVKEAQVLAEELHQALEEMTGEARDMR